MDANEITEQLEVERLAAQVDCFTEAQVQKLAAATPLTVKAWRDRGKGPQHVVFGNQFLYPREPFKQFLMSLLRERKTAVAKNSL